MIINRLLPYFTALLVFIGLEILPTAPQKIYYIFGFFVLIIFLAVWRLIGFREIRKIGRWNFLVTPILFILGGGLILVFVEDTIYRQILFFGIPLLLGFYLEALFVYIYEHENYRQGVLENLFSVINLAAFYFLFSGIYGLKIFIGLPAWSEILIALPFIVLLVYENFWINKMVLARAKSFLAVNALLLFELFLAIEYLPSGFYVKGLILSAGFYLLTGLSLDYHNEKVEKWAIVRYSVIVAVSLAAVMLTAQWI